MQCAFLNISHSPLGQKTEKASSLSIMPSSTSDRSLAHTHTHLHTHLSAPCHPDETEGGGQFVYTFFYQQPHQRGKPSSKAPFNPNRARIAFPFSSIAGLAVDKQNLILHVQLNQPPRTWVGTQ
eukprot:scaffold125428_cov15-Tisochrysis_lutea.AAC.1